MKNFDREFRNGSKYKTILNFSIKPEELRLANPEELKPMTEIFYNSELEPKNFSKTLILDKNDFVDGIDSFRRFVASKIRRKELFLRKK